MIIGRMEISDHGWDLIADEYQNMILILLLVRFHFRP